MLIRLLLRTVYIIGSLAIFAFAGSVIANPLFHVHYKYGWYFGLGVVLAFVGDALTVFWKADELTDGIN